jgi:hypothetical protein
MSTDLATRLAMLLGAAEEGDLWVSTGLPGLRELAQKAIDRDIDHYPTAILRLFSALTSRDQAERLTLDHIEHLLWTHQRRVLWRSGGIKQSKSIGCTLKLINPQHIEATIDHPTILMTPMVLPYEDVLWMIRTALGSRPIVLYGEGLGGDRVVADVGAVVDLSNIRVVGGGASAVRSILSSLAHKGVFATYPDFVYAGHPTIEVPFLGVRRPFSASFVAICSRPGQMLLPVLVRRSGSEITAELMEPTLVTAPGRTQAHPRWTRQLMAQVVAGILERLILANPAQWCLLGTLIGQAPQMAGTAMRRGREGATASRGRERRAGPQLGAGDA